MESKDRLRVGKLTKTSSNGCDCQLFLPLFVTNHLFRHDNLTIYTTSAVGRVRFAATEVDKRLAELMTTDWDDAQLEHLIESIGSGYEDLLQKIVTLGLNYQTEWRLV